MNVESTQNPAAGLRQDMPTQKVELKRYPDFVPDQTDLDLNQAKAGGCGGEKVRESRNPSVFRGV